MEGLEKFEAYWKEKEGPQQTNETETEFKCLLVLDGTLFLVDLSNEWIYEMANPSNYISFNELEEYGREYSFVYDPIAKNKFKGDEEEQAERIDLKYIVLKELKWMPAFGFVWSRPQENTIKISR